MHPQDPIHGAADRPTIMGIPNNGWFRKQKILIIETLKAYPINNALCTSKDEIYSFIKG